MEMEVTAWRKLLENIIADAQERQRIANRLGVNPATLVRWTRGETNPRYENLQRLLKALPEQQETLTQLLLEEFPTFDMPVGEDISEQIVVCAKTPGAVLPPGIPISIRRCCSSASNPWQATPFP